MKYFFASVLFLFANTAAFAWGGRGHDTICQTAVYLVKNKTLKSFLLNKPNMMGHLCNVPDTHWRSLALELTKAGNPTHYVNTGMLGLNLKDIPLDLPLLIEKYTGTENKLKPGTKIISVPQEMGTNWWRANQFYDMSIASGKKLKTLIPPADPKQEQDESLPYNKSLYEMLTYMGIMGHFVGDNSQPLHNDDDYDGYNAGHGGIHAYYEDLSVSFFGTDLSTKILNQAKVINANTKLKKFLTEDTTLKKMKALGVISNSETKAIFKLDPIIKKSIVLEEKGMKIKTKAERKSAEVGNKVFSKLIVNQMARSSLLLAQMWDEIYTEIGKPELTAYKSYRYPLSPDFIMPDYFEIKSIEIKN